VGRFSAFVQTGSEFHPASCTLSTGYYSRVQRSEILLTTQPHLGPTLLIQLSY